MTQNNTVDSEEIKILLNQISFALPCKSFNIQYSYTKQERLPIVTEFIVRLIHTCQSIAVSNIQEYFGFSSKETEVIVNSLINERLVVFNQDDELELTEYAKSKFEESSDNLPRFFKIEEDNKSVKFNLISFKPLFKDDNEKCRFCINLNESDEHISKSIHHAEMSFEHHFHDIVQNDDKKQLYKIKEVTAKKHFSASIPLDFHLKIDAESASIINSKENEELIKRDEAIYKAIIDTFSSNVFREYDKQEGYLLDFIKIFKDNLIGNKIDSRDKLNLLNYVKEVHLQKNVKYEDETDALLGNVYVDGEFHNFDSVKNVLKKYEGKKFHKSVCWLLPQNSFFGRTRLFNNFISHFSEKKIELKILLPIEEEQKNYLIDTNGFETYGYVQPIMGGHLEVFLYAPYFVCVLFHYYQVSGSFSSVSIPIGFISENPEKVEKARKLIFEYLQSDQNYRGKEKNKNEQPNFKEDFYFLDFQLILT
ncbi:hypothetical protein [Beggiatoa leptomitoformis]|uniref:Uncharacterized protein n=1 Tax=Beggiatoa leptomitoformis TaxID=288004 RepID=A0A2N9YA54_9GAMM|nr:hypothetical protein [Beggiatoa leptomitoformis]ALG67240.1 hypothetical protein AL038_05385 [Beggiatoa leptomitoformis]AUI67340.1 hypothetical protein BLE401_00595 [Beggiatoa leptomitoformis]